MEIVQLGLRDGEGEGADLGYGRVVGGFGGGRSGNIAATRNVLIWGDAVWLLTDHPDIEADAHSHTATWGLCAINAFVQTA